MPPSPILIDEKTHSGIYERVVREALFRLVTSSPNPRIILVGGQPGAGKTKAAGQALEGLRSEGYGAALINGDDLRPFHPKYAELIKQDKATAAEKTGLDVGLWVERAIREAAEKKYNVVVETTLRQPEKVRQTLAAFKQHGFAVELRVLVVDKAYSNLGIYQRFAHALSIKNAVPRFTPQRFHESTLQQMPLSIEVAASVTDKITYLNRENTVLYDTQQSTQKPVDALLTLRKQNLSPKQLAEIAYEWKQLRLALDRSGVPAPIRAGVRQEQARAMIAVKFSEKAQQELANIERKSIPPSLTKPRKR